jgi:hypothetical protein
MVVHLQTEEPVSSNARKTCSDRHPSDHSGVKISLQFITSRPNFDPHTLTDCCSSPDIQRRTLEEDGETFRHPCLQIFPVRDEIRFVGSEFALCFFKIDMWSSYRRMFPCNGCFCESESICGAIQALFQQRFARF